MGGLAFAFSEGRAVRGCLLLVGLISWLVVPHAEAGRGSGKTQGARTVELRYEGGAVPYVTCIDCPTVEALPGERYVTVEVVDDNSPVGYVDIAWFHPEHDYFSVCGKTEEPEQIPRRAELRAFPWVVPDTPCPTGFSTSGTIKITFLRKV